MFEPQTSYLAGVERVDRDITYYYPGLRKERLFYGYSGFPECDYKEEQQS
ncbi:hypothetical protein [Lysinibacillus xylanilyticus]